MKAPRPTYEVDGAAIRKIRMSRGIKIADLARNARISRSYLTRLEIGVRTNMRPPTYAALRTALELDPEDEQLLAPREPNTE
ncbi:helix-turn-helix transcriptional regulator [Streptomyces sp. P9(2023)]|uniref:helix-turn-helix domain-containing protein n=1 Tax=Streptomyces sp. P9(2023) TaxID=3064394 RepID=UPI0028F3E251|nr:helix-turn-helix transcriptional regulator [Streptomyces sp. P9(2023)]MDT9688152.1 helix-turn-helix transcriptional regulator [Streptomyces sp. P9(2023)]